MRVQRVEVLTISLPSALARRRLMQAQLDSPGMPPHRFLDAVEGRKLTSAEKAQLYDDAEAQLTFGHSMSDPGLPSYHE
jgi:hypothetical protein